METSKKINERLTNVKKHGWGLLDLRNCGLTEIPPEIFEFTSLVNLDLSNDPFCSDKMKNRINCIPEQIGTLQKLVRLNISDNQVSEISENLASLVNLEYLDLSKNALTDLPARVANMPSLKTLLLEGNPFDMLPPEIVTRGIESIRNFFTELEEKDFLYEVKLIIVGEGRVGKTCISKAIMDNNFKLADEQSTEGININSWIIPKSEIVQFNKKIQRDFQINLWDFGGQEIYHSTHQFFLTKRSIYLLVTESRKEDRHDDFTYWLNIIKLLGDKSPVLIVLNKCDQPTKELPVKEYKENFDNIEGFEKISLKEGYEDTLENFKNKLKQIAAKLPHIGNPLPKVWVDIRNKIEALKKSGANYITEYDYLEICKQHYRKTESALFLSEYFHDLGVLLHFQDDIDLKDTVILNHEWITSGVYKILDDQKVIDQKGRFSIEDLKRIWSKSEYRFKIRELLSLMKNRKFDLCFELASGEYLVPRLLPVDEIQHNWVSSPGNLKFEFRYQFMPKGILTRLIVKMSKDIKENKYWRYGVLLKYENTEAIVKEKYFENKITIELKGQYSREFLYMIRKAINEIHEDFNNLKVDEMVPCICNECKTSESPFFYQFDVLSRYEFKEIAEIRCDKSLEMVKVSDLTSDILRSKLWADKIVFCENSNATSFNKLQFENYIFHPEANSGGVFIRVRNKPDNFGIRDRDFLTDSEVKKIKARYPNYFILDYYCFENYLYHPDNIMELNIAGFDKSAYINELINQKNINKREIISNFKKARDSYQEFKVDTEGLRIKSDEYTIMDNLESDDIEVFFKSFSLKDKCDKEILKKFSIKKSELCNTNWFKNKMWEVMNFVRSFISMPTMKTLVHYFPGLMFSRLL